MNAIIANAIRNKRVLRFTYRGHARTVEPHAYGVSSANNEVLRCYQTAGTSESGAVPDWKLMLVNEISGLSDAGTGFAGPRPGYKKDDKGMTTIYVQL